MTEARGSRGEFGANRLTSLLTAETSRPGEHGEQMLERILSEVRLFSGRVHPDDDMTLLSLCVGP